MISNERQLANAHEKLEQLRAAIAELDGEDVLPYQDLAAELMRRVDDYVAARDGRVKVFKISNVDDLAAAVVKARIARGWTQKQLAEELDVSEQMVQKAESRQYENVGLAKLADLFDALEYELVGQLRPRFVSVEQWRPDTSSSSAKHYFADCTFTGGQVLRTPAANRTFYAMVGLSGCTSTMGLNETVGYAKYVSPSIRTYAGHVASEAEQIRPVVGA